MAEKSNLSLHLSNILRGDAPRPVKNPDGGKMLSSEWKGAETALPSSLANSAILLAIASAFGFGAAFVLTQFALRWMPPAP